MTPPFHNSKPLEMKPALEVYRWNRSENMEVVMLVKPQTVGGERKGSQLPSNVPSRSQSVHVSLMRYAPAQPVSLTTRFPPLVYSSALKPPRAIHRRFFR